LSTEKTPNKINTRKAILVRAYFVFALAVVFGFAVLFSAARLQLGSDKEFSKALKQKNTRVIDVAAVRGNIYAADGSLLATSVPTYNLVFDSRADGLTNELFKSKIDSLATKLAVTFPEKNFFEWKMYLTGLRNKKSRT
jgi:cell division protein FtsI (penicillin-binding protein 3)